MAREIRITIDDDEVFERMKRRKDERDLSWADVLRRGLADSPGASPDDDRELDPFDDDFQERLRRRIREKTEGRFRGRDETERDPDPGPGPGHESRDQRRSRGRGDEHAAGDSGDGSDRGRGDARDARGFDPFDPESVQGFVRRTVQDATPGFVTQPAAPESPRGDIDAELERLEGAEDAVLAFPFLESESARVPLRVNLRTTADGLDVDVVAVRHGKGTEDANRFPDGARGTVTRELAAGTHARLEFADGAESYAVDPALTWGRDDGVPTVADATVEAVHLED